MSIHTPDVRETSPSAPVAGTVLELLDRSRDSLLRACAASVAGERFSAAHVAALQASAALVASREPHRRRSGPRNVWQIVSSIAPELGEWSAFFAATARTRQSVDSGLRQVGVREADDLVRQSEIYLELVLRRLGLPGFAPFADRMAPLRPQAFAGMSDATTFEG